MLGATLPPQSGKAIAARRELLGERRKVAVALGELVTDLLGALDPDNRERGNADCDQRDNGCCCVVHPPASVQVSIEKVERQPAGSRSDARENRVENPRELVSP
jgi:hypothetical protein